MRSSLWNIVRLEKVKSLKHALVHSFDNTRSLMHEDIVELKPLSVVGKQNMGQRVQLKEQFGFDSLTHLESVLVNELEQSSVTTVLKKMVRMARLLDGPKRDYEFLHRLFGYSPKYYVGDPTELLTAVYNAWAQIYADTKEEATFIICSPKTATGFYNSPRFAYDSKAAHDPIGELMIAGSVDVTFQLFINHNLTDDTIIVGAANTKIENMSGLVAVEGDSSVSTTTDLQFENKIIYSKPFGTKFTGSGDKMYSKILVTHSPDSLWEHIKSKVRSWFR